MIWSDKLCTSMCVVTCLVASNIPRTMAVTVVTWVPFVGTQPKPWNHQAAKLEEIISPEYPNNIPRISQQYPHESAEYPL